MNEKEYERRMAKTADVRFLNLLENEYQYAPKIAEAILEDAHACLDGASQHIGPGQMRVILVKRGAAHGRPLKEVDKVEVVWTIDGGQKDREVAQKSGMQTLRRVRIRRLLNEALSQGAVATQEDLAEALQVSVRTIKRDCAQLKEEGISVATRGNLQGIGRGQTHKARIVERWLNGETYDQIALHTHHSISSVQRYIQTCQRVYNLEQEGFGQEEIALLLQVGRPLVAQYLALCRACDTPLAQKRLQAQRQRLKRGGSEEKRGPR